MPHLFHDPIDTGAPDPSGHPFSPEITFRDLRSGYFRSGDYIRGVCPVSIGFRGINALNL